ncbi:uncharacterized protein LOC118920009 [Manis pentadactyla]|uniref:uncharacterized protein LOC118920009 n=1 Tax=Manis pentadactyla TaxID=143292 RepID=UPI00255CED38|nr:uncharacterized protein LOC118920009 [Manis pentadactyla]
MASWAEGREVQTGRGRRWRPRFRRPRRTGRRARWLSLVEPERDLRFPTARRPRPGAGSGSAGVRGAARRPRARAAPRAGSPATAASGPASGSPAPGRVRGSGRAGGAEPPGLRARPSQQTDPAPWGALAPCRGLSRSSRAAQAQPLWLPCRAPLSEPIFSKHQGTSAVVLTRLRLSWEMCLPFSGCKSPSPCVWNSVRQDLLEVRKQRKLLLLLQSASPEFLVRTSLLVLESQSSRHWVHCFGIWKMKLWVLREMMDPVDLNTTRLAPLLTQPLVLRSSRNKSILESLVIFPRRN